VIRSFNFVKFCQYRLPMTLKVTTTLSLLILSALFLVACASSQAPKSCQELDWYELGRRDGNKAGAERQVASRDSRREVKAVCEESDQSLSEALYNNGFDAGRAQYNNQASAQMTEEHDAVRSRLAVINAQLEDKSIDVVRRGLIRGEKLELEQKIKKLETQIQAASN
jgi:hypothetical protein